MFTNALSKLLLALMLSIGLLLGLGQGSIVAETVTDTNLISRGRIQTMSIESLNIQSEVDLVRNLDQVLSDSAVLSESNI
jgi:hypothetical protein